MVLQKNIVEINIIIKKCKNKICEKYGLPCVPIVDDNYQLPNTIEELQAFVESEGSRIDGLPREGIVFYDKETGHEYFKFVSPEFLIKYHGG